MSRASAFLRIRMLAVLFAGGCLATSDLPQREGEVGYWVNDGNASFFDVPARQRYLRKAGGSAPYNNRPAPKTCPALEPIDYRVTMPAFYANRQGWWEANKPFFAFETAVGRIAGGYVATGDRKHVRCLAEILVAWARADALTKFDYMGNSKSAWLAIQWATAAAAMSYSVVRSNPALKGTERKIIETWLRKVVKIQTSFPGGPYSCCNNVFYWRGLQAAIVGVVSGDDHLLQYGIDAYRSALTDMNEDGSLPLEMKRGERALHYQNFAIMALIYIAEIARRQGYDLYGLSIDGKDIHLAIRFLLDTIDDPTPMQRYSSREQDLSFLGNGRDLNWMEPYHARFGNRRIEQWLVAARPIFHRWSGGPSTLFFHVPRPNADRVFSANGAQIVGRPDLVETNIEVTDHLEPVEIVGVTIEPAIDDQIAEASPSAAAAGVLQ